MFNLEDQSKPEAAIEREKFEKIILLIRHPSTQIEVLASQGDNDTPWDSLEDRVRIEKGKGHDMTRLLAQHLVAEIPEIVRTSKGNRDYKIVSGPLPRTKVMARYDLSFLREAHKHDPNIPLPVETGVEVIDNFTEIPMTYTKGQILELVEKTRKEGKPLMSVMEEWFKSDPIFIASVFEKERQRVTEGLKKIVSDPTPITLIHTHRLVTGFILWLIANKKFDEPITPNDLPGIMEIARKLPYTSESELGWNSKEGWNILRKGDTTHLDEGLIGGTF
ncbi:MAG: hypothetical protein WCV68_00840 [Candidatus Paceibacterota bacterium]|jgi:hypothetical protein